MNNVNYLREQRGMTQEEFAEYCGVARISIARYDAGEEISRKNAQKIAAACNVPIAFVLGEPGAEEYLAQPSRDEVAAIIADLTPDELTQVQRYAEFLRSSRQ